MPCMGPSMPDGLAERITDEVLEWLFTQHHVGSGRGLDEPNNNFEFRDEHKLKLRDVLKDLLWDDICRSF